MRAIAACAILIWHSWLYSSPSGTPVHQALFSHALPDLQFGVILFFALSGFLLYRPFAAIVLGERSGLRIGGYLRNRALRILPCYWVILVFAAIVLDTTQVREHGRLVPGGLHSFDLARTAAFAENYTPRSVGLGIGPAWSLAVEVVFYLVLPFLALAAYALGRRAGTKRGNRLAGLFPAAALLLFGLSGKLVAGVLVPGAPSQWGQTWHSVVELSFWGMADLFAFGMALAVLYVEVDSGRIRLPRLWLPVTAIAAFGAYVLVAVSTTGEQLSYRPSNTVIAAACALLLALVVLPTAAKETHHVFLRFLELRPVRTVGTISYGIFLWHVPILFWLRAHGLFLSGLAGFLVNTLLLFVVTAACSYVTYRYVEAPALRLKQRRLHASQGRAVPLAP
jgi:peptidoglycan/LPS O-acetylase OafA/YrhL